MLASSNCFSFTKFQYIFHCSTKVNMGSCNSSKTDSECMMCLLSYTNENRLNIFAQYVSSKNNNNSKKNTSEEIRNMSL